MCLCAKVVFITLILYSQGHIEPLPNGLIVSRHENAKLVAAKHDVLIILEKPKWPSEINGMIAIVKKCQV